MATYTPLQVPTYQLREIVPQGWQPLGGENHGVYTRLQSFQLALVHFSAHADHPSGRPEALLIGQIYEEHFLAARIVFGHASTFTASYKLTNSLEESERWLDAQSTVNRFGHAPAEERSGPEPPVPTPTLPSSRAQAARSTTTATDRLRAIGPASAIPAAGLPPTVTRSRR